MVDVAQTEARVRAFAAEYVPSLGAGPLVLAVSGGGDSMALAAILCEAALVDPASVSVAHFDHRLRGAPAAARDRAVVEALGERYGLRLIFGAWETPAGGEAAAREARYRFLAETALAWGAAAVATGHTEDDQVETIVLHTLRGSGPYGTAGMAPERAWPHEGDGRARGLRLLRPLLSLPRGETRAYCAARGLAYADDASNDDPAFARNRVRAMLADVDAETPEARAIILRTGELARGSIAVLEAAAERAAPLYDAEDGRAVGIDRAALRALPPELTGYAWHRALERLLGDTRDFGRGHFATMHAAAGARTGALFELPRGVVLTVDAGELLLSVGPLTEPPVDPAASHPLPFAGTLGGWEVDVRAAADGGGQGEVEGELATRLPADAVLRARRAGDRVALAGGRGHRKLHDAYIDAKVPRRRRDGAPVIAGAEVVLWTPLLRLPPPDGAGVRYLLRWRRRGGGAPVASGAAHQAGDVMSSY